MENDIKLFFSNNKWDFIDNNNKVRKLFFNTVVPLRLGKKKFLPLEVFWAKNEGVPPLEV